MSDSLVTTEDIPWSSTNTWIVIIVSGTLLLLIIGGTTVYEVFYKPNSFASINGKCIPVRDGEFTCMEACMQHK